MTDKEKVEMIIKQGDCEGLPCITCPLFDRCDCETVSIFNRREIVDLAKKWLEENNDYITKVNYFNKSNNLFFNELKEIRERLEKVESKVKEEDKVDESFSCDIKASISLEDVNYLNDVFKKLKTTPVKDDEPEIIGNVMRWKGKDYLKWVRDGICRKEVIVIKDRLHFAGWIWKIFSDIEITDELTCMRKKDQPIWVMCSQFKSQYIKDFSDKPHRLYGVNGYGSFIVEDIKGNSAKCLSCRLANIDDLKKAGII